MIERDAAQTGGALDLDLDAADALLNGLLDADPIYESRGDLIRKRSDNCDTSPGLKRMCSARGSYDDIFNVSAL